jgi:hypothetical protein
MTQVIQTQQSVMNVQQDSPVMSADVLKKRPDAVSPRTPAEKSTLLPEQESHHALDSRSAPRRLRGTQHELRSTEGLIEYYSGFVDWIDESGLQAIVTSRDGSSRAVFIPFDKIPETEREFAEAGAPVRVAVHARGNPKYSVRFLRPSQWKLPAAAIDAGVQVLSRKINELLGAGSGE